jgi:hypothetical protein
MPQASYILLNMYIQFNSSNLKYFKFCSVTDNMYNFDGEIKTMYQIYRNTDNVMLLIVL